MKEIFKKLGILVMLVAVATGCVDDDTKFGDINTPTALSLNYNIMGQDAANPNGDGTGYVQLKAYAEGAISYKYIFPSGDTKTVAGGELMYRFTSTGINDYEITVIAYGRGGVSTSNSFVIEDVLSNFDDPVTTGLLTGTGSKVWYWAAAEQGHLGVGPNTPTGNNYWPEWYAAAPFEKAGSPESSCLYTNKLTFTLDGSMIKLSLENEGTFFNAAFTSVGGGNQTTDACLPYNVSGQKNVMLAPAQSYVPEEFSTGTQMTFSDGGFMGYYIGQSTYEILELTENRMVVRAIMGGDDALAWYHIFTTQDPSATPDPEYNNLIWADEFDVDGAPNAANWTLEEGNNNGWGNQELQHYTQSGNAAVSGGILTITANKNQDGIYNSARMISRNKFDFTYGRVEIRAKLPTELGSWPALWMLGSNYTTNPWPGCGEIDIMEYAANVSPTTISGTLHYPGNFGGSANTGSTQLADPSEWHTYTLIWSPEVIKWYIDDNPAFKTFVNSNAHPYFNWNYFLIMNIAVGGNFTQNYTPTFLTDSMEVDYVRVYQ
ncbi:laminarinase [Flavobacterium akiainvivens]|uniref:Laminarinase n=1 Tax=Flavobacterium akiainvivens TaxID=1202724 RepID=A0A0M9VH48_9FLAO|nr:glycoside hydrolase family 16 protein [Flavobacterium akiainvivens]KOS05176.1 laminarinase [Flavobacterium akiainvivens]SFQ50893.1 Glycosyl hydrolases family 16 [Flavobacterium akiainvivens]